MRVICDVCNRVVEDMIWSRDEMRSCNTLTVRCHGAEESMVLSDYDLANMPPETVTYLETAQGRAFVSKAIESARP